MDDENTCSSGEVAFQCVINIPLTFRAFGEVPLPRNNRFTLPSVEQGSHSQKINVWLPYCGALECASHMTVLANLKQFFLLPWPCKATWSMFCAVLVAFEVLPHMICWRRTNHRRTRGTGSSHHAAHRCTRFVPRRDWAGYV